jgi:putative copper resistance protein D
MVFALMGLHAGFGVWLLAQPAALAPEHFLELPVPYIADLLTDQRLGAIIGWVLSEVATIVAVIVLVTRWIRHDRHVAGAPGEPARYPQRHREQLFAGGTPSPSRGRAGTTD